MKRVIYIVVGIIIALICCYHEGLKFEKFISVAASEMEAKIQQMQALEGLKIFIPR